jgi:hypothetical protein
VETGRINMAVPANLSKTHLLVTTRTNKQRAEKVKKSLESYNMISARIVEKPGVYEVWAKPTAIAKSMGYTLKSKLFTSYVRLMQYNPDGSVI